MRILTCLVVTATAACRPASSDGFPSADQRIPRAAHARVAVTSAPEAEFTAITGLDADSRGRIFVADWMKQRVTVLSPDGRVLRTVGAPGAGPGEFRAIRGVQVLRGDSVAVYDPELARVTVYEPGSLSVASTVNLGPKLRGGAPFLVWRARSGGYLALFRSGFMFSSAGAIAERRDSVAVLGADGSPRSTIARVPARGFLVEGTSITPNPFGREPLARLDTHDRVRYLWTDTFAVRTFDIAGRPVSRWAVEYPSPRVTEDHARAELAAMGEHEQRTFQRALADSVPPTWPAVRDLLVDDSDRVWVALPAPGATPQEWAVFTSEGRYIRSVMLPAGVVLRSVRGGRLYGERRGEDDVPTVVALTLDGRLG